MHREATTDAARRSEGGQTMAEYAIVLAVITLAILLTLQLIGDSAGNLIQEINDLAGW